MVLFNQELGENMEKTNDIGDPKSVKIMLLNKCKDCEKQQNCELIESANNIIEYCKKLFPKAKIELETNSNKGIIVGSFFWEDEDEGIEVVPQPLWIELTFENNFKLIYTKPEYVSKDISDCHKVAYS